MNGCKGTTNPANQTGTIVRSKKPSKTNDPTRDKADKLKASSLKKRPTPLGTLREKSEPNNKQTNKSTNPNALNEKVKWASTAQAKKPTNKRAQTNEPLQRLTSNREHTSNTANETVRIANKNQTLLGNVKSAQEPNKAPNIHKNNAGGQ